MIFRRALIKELAQTSILVLGIVLGVITVTTGLHYLGQAATGSIPPDMVLAFLGFGLLDDLPVVLSLTLFISVLLTLTRSYSDSEMIVWFSAGLSLTAWIRPILYFALPQIAIIALVSLFLGPWTGVKRAEYKQQLESRNEISAVAPGVFKESRHSERVYFVEHWDRDKERVGNIFVQTRKGNRIGIMVAERGYQAHEDNGDNFLVLLNGRRYEGVPGMADYQIDNFQSYAIRVEPYETKATQPSTKIKSTIELTREDSLENFAELQWRVSLPISALLLVLLALPLSFFNPRAGRTMHFLLAILIYLTYENFLGVSQSWIAKGVIHPYVGLWWVHGVIMILAGFLFYRRMVKI